MEGGGIVKDERRGKGGREACVKAFFCLFSWIGFEDRQDGAHLE